MTADFAEALAACPTDAIIHGHGFECAGFDTTALVRRKEDMLRLWPPAEFAR